DFGLSAHACKSVPSIGKRVDYILLGFLEAILVKGVAHAEPDLVSCGFCRFERQLSKAGRLERVDPDGRPRLDFDLDPYAIFFTADNPGSINARFVVAATLELALYALNVFLKCGLVVEFIFIDARDAEQFGR